MENQTTNKSLVIYHRADFDGICSREVARLFLGKTADYFGWDYSDGAVDKFDQYQTVYLIDISMPKEVMDKYKDKIIWIDHHKSAIEINDPAIAGIRIDGVAACRLAYQYFFGNNANGFPTKQDFFTRNVVEPEAVRYLGEYDVWDKRDPNTDLFQVGLSSVRNIEWDMLLNLNYTDTNHITEKGRVIWDYLEVNNKQIANERGFDIQFHGLKLRVLNTCRCSSLTFKDSVTDHDGCMGYHWNSRVWAFSLYGIVGKPDVDLLAVAKIYGGGGHKQACGFTMAELPPELGGKS